jgi:hypothetical protein
MSETKLDELLNRLPEISKVVNEFKSEMAQLRVLDALLGAFGPGVETKDPQKADKAPSTRRNFADERASPTTDQPAGSVESRGTEKTSRRRSGKSSDLSFVSDLNLRPKDKQTLREFFDTKQPTSNEQTFAVVIYYLKAVLNVEKVGANHVYTAFKDLNLKVPLRLATVISNAAARHRWIDTKSSNDYQMTTHGENFVEHDLPAKGKAKKS